MGEVEHIKNGGESCFGSKFERNESEKKEETILMLFTKESLSDLVVEFGTPHLEIEWPKAEVTR